MGFLYKREMPIELKRLNILSKRMTLTDEELNRLRYQRKGFEGELALDAMLSGIDDRLLLAAPDLIFSVNNQWVQIDLLALSGSRLIVFEVKNFNGDYQIQDGEWYSPFDNLVKNPLLQLDRTVTILKQHLKSLGLAGIHVEGKVVFPDPSFWLFGFKKEDPVLFSGRIGRFLHSLMEMPAPIRQEHRYILDQLITHQHPDRSKFEDKVAYDFNGIGKGVYCANCDQHLHRRTSKRYQCKKCGSDMDSFAVIADFTREFQLLFPDELLTTANLYRFSNGFLPKKTIRRFLLRNHSENEWLNVRPKSYV